jgi:uncharacterized CHY-type Zn-finger protein
MVRYRGAYIRHPVPHFFMSPKPAIRGKPIDSQTRCVHFHSEKDIVAIKFRCCNHYYPCHQCHEENAGHTAVVWPRSDWDTPAVLCGACGGELTIREYFSCGDTCPACHAAFNPNCRLHYNLYFEP